LQPRSSADRSTRLSHTLGLAARLLGEVVRTSALEQQHGASTYALRLSAPLFHYDPNRDPTSAYPDAHVQVPGSMNVRGDGWAS
jgi:hypothetical protein